MPIRNNSNPRPLALPAELQEILVRNGMTAQVVGSSEGFALVVQSHDSPMMTYAITSAQLKALTDWGTNTANRRAYNTFASIVAVDFDMPKDFVHARNANGRVAMGLHGYRVGVGEYGRVAPAYGYHGVNPYRYPHHMMGPSFLGWMPRQQEGWHMRRIGGQLYYPGAPMVPNRSDGRMKPGELQSGGYGFYYKHNAVQQGAGADVLTDLQAVITPMKVPQLDRPEKSIPYNSVIASDVYFTVDHWQEVLKSHGIAIDPETKTMTVQSSGVDADLQYTLTQQEIDKILASSVTEVPIQERIDLINRIVGDDFADAVTMDMLNSDKLIDIKLHPEVQRDLEAQLAAQELQLQQIYVEPEIPPLAQEELPKGSVLMDGKDLEYMHPEKGWFREGRHGREVVVDDIRVEPIQPQEEGGKMTYRMSAVIDGEVISHEISQKQYDKFMAVDDYHRMKLFSKIFKEVDMKDRYPQDLGMKITAGLAAGLVATDIIMHRGRPMPPCYMEAVPGPAPHVYFKPGVDTPADVAARQFDAMVNDPGRPHGPAIGM